MHFSALFIGVLTIHSINGIQFGLDIESNLKYLRNIGLFLSEMRHLFKIERCLTIITDNAHYSLYDEHFFNVTNHVHTIFFIKINESESLGSPNYQTVRVLKQALLFKCDVYVITILNGWQTRKLLQLNQKLNVLYTRSKLLLPYDNRFLTKDMLYVWTLLTDNYFYLQNDGVIYSISYMGVLSNVVVMQYLFSWESGKSIQKKFLTWKYKKNDLKNITVNVATLKHEPMVIHDGNGSITGVEVEIIKILGKVLNFTPNIYDAPVSGDFWGKLLPNGSYSGLLGEVTSHRAQIIVGDLHYVQTYWKTIDLSLPHTIECLTFLTPESTKDNSWRTLIQPFGMHMWAGVLASLFVVGIIFYFTSFLHNNIINPVQKTNQKFFKIFRKLKHPQAALGDIQQKLRSREFRTRLNKYRGRRKQEDIFDSFSNCILLTYSMLMYVALPKMPLNWPLRVLTGCYWVYCILVTVTYRASFTAILANPIARTTIDSLEDLRQSKLTTATWGIDNKNLFEDAFDSKAQQVATKMMTIENIDIAAELVFRGDYAYFDSASFLRFLRYSHYKHKNLKSNGKLHIMKNCIFKMPVGLGMEKRSPLKSAIDKYLQLLLEAGLVAKLEKDTKSLIPFEESLPQEALMDLNKFWSSFIGLLVGYILSILALICEIIHFSKVVTKHPMYDEYNKRLYINFKRKFPNTQIK